MNQQQDLFCREFVANSFNGVQAYMAAYPDSSYGAAGGSAHELLKNPQIQDRITELLRDRMARLNLQADDVLRLLWATVTADPNELVEVRRDCCRHCYGLDHLYQHTPAEWEEVQRKHLEACQRAEAAGGKLPPEPPLLGGIGYDARFPPYPDCPECFGRGIESIHLKDTRTLSPAARQLYAGARQTKNGIEILTHSRDKALELLGKHLALFTENVNHTNNGGSFQPMTLDQFYGSAKPESEPS